MAEPNTPEKSSGGQFRLPLGQKTGEPTPPKDPVQERLNQQVESGFAQSAALYGITVEQVRTIQDALDTQSPEAFKLIQKGMSPTEAIAAVKQGK